MKKFSTFFLLIVFFTVSACAPSESAVATAIAETKAVDELVEAATQLAELEQSLTQIPKEEEKLADDTTVAQTIDIENYPFCHPNQVCEDLSDEPQVVPYANLIKVDTTLDGENLTIVFYIEEIPEEFELNRDDVEIGYEEYAWKVSIDLDDDIDTGGSIFLLGIEYEVYIGHAKFEKGIKRGPFEEIFDIQLLEFDEKGTGWIIDEPEIQVDYDENTVSLQVNVPGINNDSILYCSTSTAGNDKFGSDTLDDMFALSELGKTNW